MIFQVIKLMEKTSNTPYKVFILEDDKNYQKLILEELKEKNYKIEFFSKEHSVFEILEFNPDIIIQDYRSKKILNCFEWN